jgi:predicted phosphodiesterase
MFDRSFLPPADLEFVVMTDTHYMLDPGTQKIEFESRRKQAARAVHAMQLVRSLEPAFVVHLGDLVQEFPEGGGFEQAVDEALAQIGKVGLELRQVAGNHDVGDKPDPTMPTDWASDETLARYDERFGRSWYSWNEGGFHFVVLNSQIMNGPLAAANEQERWLEGDLAEHSHLTTVLFMHLSPYLVFPDEQGLGHYDNIDEPARGWLLSLIRQHNIQMVFSGHTHFSFFNRLGDARIRVVPSTAFTRPGFCEVFSSAPPPERGRDDIDKLGFLLLRSHDGEVRTHLIRTRGVMGAIDDAGATIVAATTGDVPGSSLGVTLRHPLAPHAEVPIAWQSTVRQPVRNDYPLLALVEMGTRYARVPASDLSNETHRGRLEVLKNEGVDIVATWTWSKRSTLVKDVGQSTNLLAGIEVQVPGKTLPDDACLDAIATVSRSAGVPVALAPLLPREIVPGKQHARTRIGFHLDELLALDRVLTARNSRVDRVLCRVDATQQPWETITSAVELGEMGSIGTLDWAVEFADTDPAAQVRRAIEALAAVATFDDSRIYLEPLIDLDRTMDAPLGLLDRLCNPRTVFHAVRTLNTVLYGRGGRWELGSSASLTGARTLSLAGEDEQLVVVLPGPAGVELSATALSEIAPEATSRKVIDLELGEVLVSPETGTGSLTLSHASVVHFIR